VYGVPTPEIAIPPDHPPPTVLQLKRWVEEPHNCKICDVGKTRKTIRDKTAQFAIEQYCANGRTAQLAIIRLIDSCQRYSLVEELHKLRCLLHNAVSIVEEPPNSSYQAPATQTEVE